MITLPQWQQRRVNAVISCLQQMPMTAQMIGTYCDISAAYVKVVITMARRQGHKIYTVHGGKAGSTYELQVTQ